MKNSEQLDLKTAVRDACYGHLQTRHSSLTAALTEISESINTETKSSVGDKHETARARIARRHRGH